MYWLDLVLRSLECIGRRGLLVRLLHQHHGLRADGSEVGQGALLRQVLSIQRRVLVQSLLKRIIVGSLALDQGTHVLYGFGRGLIESLL